MALDYQTLTCSIDVTMRLDRWLRRIFPGATQGMIERAIRGRYVRVNNERCKAATRLEEGDHVQVETHLLASWHTLEKETPASPAQHWAPPVLEETADFLVLNKPSGLDVQGGHGISQSIAAWLLQRNPELRLVHRLDRDTSGVLVVAKNLRTAINLTQMFREHRIKKVYRALVLGELLPEAGTVDAPIAPDPDARARVCINFVEGRPAQTNYKTLRYNPEQNWSEVALYPASGRKHQLRVHMAHINAPILGDKKYDPERKTFYLAPALTKGQLFLHAERLSFIDSAGYRHTWTAPLPPYWPA